MAVRKRGQRWHYDFQVRGIRHRGSIPEARNKAQAERAEAKIKLDLFERRFGDGTSKGFADFVKEIYEPIAKLKLSYERGDKLHLPVFIAHFHNTPLASIGPADVERFRQALIVTPRRSDGKRRKPSSVNRVMATLSRILSMACDNGLIPANPCGKVKRLRENNMRTRFLTEEEESHLMAAIHPQYERLRPFIILALNTGMRQGEIVGLTWEQVDWQRNLIAVRQTKNEQDRTIPMTETVKTLLLTLWRDSAVKQGRVFTISANIVQRAFQRLVRRAKIADFKFHDLRHTFATRLAGSTDAFTLAALLGHKTLAMTARYTHPTDAGKRQAIAALNALASQTGQENVTIPFPARAVQAG